MIEEKLQELHDTWDYTIEELNDIRNILEEIAHAYFWMGYGERSQEVEEYYSGFVKYGKREDFE